MNSQQGRHPKTSRFRNACLFRKRGATCMLPSKLSLETSVFVEMSLNSKMGQAVNKQNGEGRSCLPSPSGAKKEHCQDITSEFSLVAHRLMLTRLWAQAGLTLGSLWAQTRLNHHQPSGEHSSEHRASRELSQRLSFLVIPMSSVVVCWVSLMILVSLMIRTHRMGSLSAQQSSCCL